MGTDVDETYLSDLLSYSLERLNKEPESLDKEETRLKDGMRETAVRNYRAFVDAGGCYQSVRDEVREIQRGLEALRGSLPELRAGCQRFAGRAEEISRARALNRRTLAAQGTLLDLLETPALQETCLRHGNYDEALDLEAHVEKLAALHAADVPVVAELAEGSKRSSSVMLKQLLTRLRGAIQLPECLRVVGYLRRMSALDEVGLRRTFLQCREGHVADAVADLDDTNAYEYLKRLTDLHRVHLFDVVMQYRAIFGDGLEDEDADQAGDFAERDELDTRREMLADAMDVLNDREKDILVQRRLSDETITLEDLSTQYGVSRERIRQIEVRAFEKLQERMQELARDKGMIDA